MMWRDAIVLFFALLLFALFTSSASAQRANGEPCSRDADCASGACYPGPDRHPNDQRSVQHYCIAHHLACAWEGYEGDDKHSESYITITVRGREVQKDLYTCANPNIGNSDANYRWQNLFKGARSTSGTGGKPNGIPCFYANECRSGLCYKGPEGINLCMAADKVCPIPGGSGVKHQGEYNWGEQHYYCHYRTGLLNDGPANNRIPFWIGGSCSGVFERIDCHGNWLPQVFDFISRTCGRNGRNCAALIAVDQSSSAAQECVKYCQTAEWAKEKYNEQRR